MGRTCTITITESVGQIDALLDMHRGGRGELRLQLLKVLKQRNCTIREAAELIGCCERSARRWLGVYGTGGVDAMLHRCDRPLRRQPDAPQRADVVPLPDMLQLLNSLPICDDPVMWSTQLRAALQMFFHDVDRILIGVNLRCRPEQPAQSSADYEVIEYLVDAPSSQSPVKLKVRRRGSGPGATIVGDLKNQGVPLEKYHQPIWFDYQGGNSMDIGTVILLRESTRSPISLRTIRTMESMSRFMVFLFSDCLARQKERWIDIETFNAVIRAVRETTELTPREQEVLIHRLLGRKYREIASQMSITTATVNSHLRRIRTKCGVESLRQLMVRYSAPMANQASLRGGMA